MSADRQAENSNKMVRNEDISLVSTIKERCKICYTCVRECPAKAIKIANGQAEVIQKRCIGCGNCVKVCRQNAKVFYNSVNNVLDLLKENENVVACIAPSFPAEFTDFKDYQRLVGAIKSLGFKNVHEVAFGADLTALKYKEILKDNNSHYISSDCPAIVAFVEKYFPQLVPSLAPFASPMVVTARVLKKKYGDDIKIVFIGPCIAKKEESHEIDEVLTFKELRELFLKENVLSKNIIPCDFDMPIAGKGAIFPLSRGLLQTAGTDDSIIDGNVIVSDGKTNFPEALREFEKDLSKTHHLELLCCEGCVMGAGMTIVGESFTKRINIKNYVNNKLKTFDVEKWQEEINKYIDLDFSQSFTSNDQRILIASPDEIERILFLMGKTKKEDHLDCGACGYDSCTEHAIAIYKGLAESEMCLPFAIDKLHNYIKDLAISNEKLSKMQNALTQSEKLAHMGQLSAGIAHELNNPLGVIIMYSNIMLEEVGPEAQSRKDLELIVEQASRCKTIVSGLLNFARNNQIKPEYIKVVELINSSLNSLIYSEKIKVERKIDSTLDAIKCDKEQMIQVISNLAKNAIEAMPNGGTLKLNVENVNNESIKIEISDTGTGISKANMDKIFTPFFTTKAPGKGTGLGLPTTYGIIKMHKGKIIVDSNDDKIKGLTGTTFTITLPINN